MSTLAAATAYLRTWGTVGQACAVLLVAAGALHWGPTQQWHSDAEQAFLANKSQSLAMASQRAAAAQPSGTPPENALPDASRFDSRLETMLGHASKAGLRLGDVTIVASSAAPPGTTQPRLELSAQGNYAAVRAFLQATLAADPALSLDQLRLSRPQVDVTDLQAHLTWTFHARAPRGANP